jgi:signal peptidase I
MVPTIQPKGDFVVFEKISPRLKRYIYGFKLKTFFFFFM